jgi:hypothetical protein
MLLASSSSLFNNNNHPVFEDNYEELGSVCKDYKTH